MICPDCNYEMMKFAIQLDDCSGWIVGWRCKCNRNHEDVELTIYADENRMAETLSDALLKGITDAQAII